MQVASRLYLVRVERRRPKAKLPRREHPVRPTRLHRQRDRHRTGGEHGDHKVVRPTSIRAPAWRYARRASWTKTYPLEDCFDD
ncbi:hypothetical protein GCM10010306_104810 [Streptomyces umbrinus]|nr:hypothetical protein GCM10010306_104810 [Streptomyces umbrinus]